MTEKKHIRQLVNVSSFIDRSSGRWRTKVAVTERVNGVKRTQFIENPKIRFHVTKQEKMEEYGGINLGSIPVEDTVQVEVEVDGMWYAIRDLQKQFDEEKGYLVEQYIKDCFANRATSNLRNLHALPFLHGSDINPADHFIDRYLENFKDNLDPAPTLRKAYWDIEVDGIDVSGFPDPEYAPAPINAMTIMDSHNNKLYGYFLDHGVYDNPLIPDFIDNKASGLIKTTGEEFGCDVEIKFFSSELKLIEEFFILVNETIKPDVMLAWNASFDMLTVINRIKKLREDPAEIMCPRSFKYKEAYYIQDEHARDIFSKRDRFNVLSEAIYTDQMANYTALRASFARQESYALEAILQTELGIGKAELDVEINRVAYHNYEQFVYYSLRDSYALDLLDKKTGDTDQLYSISQFTRTRFDKAMAKTTCLKNFAKVVYRDNGLVLSNNRNVARFGARTSESDAQESFRGAFVADPNQIKNIGTDVFEGSPSKFVHDNCVDFDLTSLYPSILIAFNIDSSTQIGKVLTNDETFQEMSDRAIEMVSSISSRDSIHTGSKFFNLPNAEELYNIFNE